MNASCPISRETVDESVVRTVAAVVVVIAIVALLNTPGVSAALLGLLAIDFGIRGLIAGAPSPVLAFARMLARTTRFTPRPVDAAPKRFAARVGMVFAVASAGLYLIGATTAGFAVAVILLGCAALESALGFCVGCKVYALIPQRLATVLAR
jgi:hypothetical protein